MKDCYLLRCPLCYTPVVGYGTAMDAKDCPVCLGDRDLAAGYMRRMRRISRRAREALAHDRRRARAMASDRRPVA